MNVFAMSVGPGHVQPAYASQLLPQFERSFSNKLGRQRLDIEVACTIVRPCVSPRRSEGNDSR